MNIVIKILEAIALALFCVALWRVATLTKHFERVIEVQNVNIDRTFSDLRDLASLSRETLQEQKAYYRDTGSRIKAAAGNTAIATRSLAELIKNSDARMERLTAASERSIASVGFSADELTHQTTVVGAGAMIALAELTRNLEQMRKLESDPAIPQSLHNIEQSTAKIADASKSASETTAHLDSAAGSIDIALLPLRKTTGAMKRVFNILLGFVKVDPTKL